MTTEGAPPQAAPTPEAPAQEGQAQPTNVQSEEGFQDSTGLGGDASALGAFLTEGQEIEDGKDPEQDAQGQGEGQERLSQMASKLAQREGKVREKEREMKNLESKAQELESLREIARVDPLKLAQYFGVDQNRFIDSIYALSGQQGGQQPEQEKRSPGDERIKALEQQIAQITQQQQASHQQRARVNVQQGLTNAAKSNAEQYPTLSGIIDQPQVIKEVMTAIDMEYKETGRYPDMHDLLRRSEDAFTQMKSKSIDWVEKNPEFKQALMERWGVQPPASPQEPQRESASPVTLSSALGGESPRREERAPSQEEREAEFIKIMQTKGWQDEEP